MAIILLIFNAKTNLCGNSAGDPTEKIVLWGLKVKGIRPNKQWNRIERIVEAKNKRKNGIIVNFTK